MDKTKKGQLFTGDFFISIAIFLLVIAILLLAFNRVSDQTRQEDDRTDLETGSTFATDVLMKTEGNPTNWTNVTVVVPGFLDNGRLSNDKMSRFMQLDYNKAKYMLGLSAFNFNMSVTDLDGNVIIDSSNRSLVYGIQFVGADSLSATYRTGVIDGQIVKIKFLLWK